MNECTDLNLSKSNTDFSLFQLKVKKKTELTSDTHLRQEALYFTFSHCVWPDPTNGIAHLAELQIIKYKAGFTNGVNET